MAPFIVWLFVIYAYHIVDRRSSAKKTRAAVPGCSASVFVDTSSSSSSSNVTLELGKKEEDIALGVSLKSSKCHKKHTQRRRRDVQAPTASTAAVVPPPPPPPLDWPG